MLSWLTAILRSHCQWCTYAIFVCECGKGGGGGGSTTIVEAPKPTAQEIAIQEQQLKLLTQQVEVAELQLESIRGINTDDLAAVQREQVALAREQLELARARAPQEAAVATRLLEVAEQQLIQTKELGPASLELQRAQLALATEQTELARKLGPQQEQLAVKQLEALEAQLQLSTESATLERQLKPFVLESLRLIEEPTGDIRRMTEEEFVTRLTPVERQAHENLQLALERERKALKGELPLTEASARRKREEFATLKEQLSRTGNPIEGDTPESAVATTTPGARALQAFNERFGLLEEAERRGELTAGTSAILQRIGITSDIGAKTRGLLDVPVFPVPEIPARTALIPNLSVPLPQSAGILIPQLGPLLQPDFAGALQPFQFQRQQQLQASVATAQAQSAAQAARAQERAGMFAGIGALGGGLIAAGGSIIGARMIPSSRRIKKDIRRATSHGEREALEMVRDLKTYTFRYKYEPDSAPKRFGLMADDAPKEIVTPDREGLDVGRTMGLLIAATRALARAGKDDK